MSTQVSPTASTRARHAAARYIDAKAEVIGRGFAWEVDWQDDRCIQALDESSFLREAAWVVLSSGLAERVVRKKFNCISDAFNRWSSASQIWTDRKRCRQDGLSAFNSSRKIDAILSLCGYIARYGFVAFRERLFSEGLEFLLRFQMFGPATSRHLAKNLGLQVAKPDRHLLRIAAALGYADVMVLCTEIANVVGDSVAVVDVVLWRYATLESGYMEYFRPVRSA